MDKADTIRLIETFQNYSNLWDRKNKDYYNRSKREESWKQISVTMEHPVANVKSKMKTLLGSYRSEKSRKKKSKNGSGPIYKSKWFAYKYFDFLKSRDNPNAAVDTAGTNTSQSEDSDQKIHALPLATASSDCTFGTPAKNGGRKRTRVQHASECDKMTTEALQISQPSAAASNDPHFIYALHLSNELKKYDAVTLALVKRGFADILFEADMGTLSADTATASFDRLYQQKYFPSPGTSTPIEPKMNME